MQFFLAASPSLPAFPRRHLRLLEIWPTATNGNGNPWVARVISKVNTIPKSHLSDLHHWTNPHREEAKEADAKAEIDSKGSERQPDGGNQTVSYQTCVCDQCFWTVSFTRVSRPGWRRWWPARGFPAILFGFSRLRPSGFLKPSSKVGGSKINGPKVGGPKNDVQRGNCKVRPALCKQRTVTSTHGDQ